MANVLVVDDSVSMRQLITGTLKEAGYQAVEAGDGQEGLKAAQSGGFDAVITDINMPNMDGIALIKELRGMTHYKFKPILVLTTESGGDMKQKGKEAGATGWIVKPFSPEKLLSAVRKVLG